MSVSRESASYTITGLQEDSNYTIITVTAINAARNAVSGPVTAMTAEAGEGLVMCYE